MSSCEGESPSSYEGDSQMWASVTIILLTLALLRGVSGFGYDILKAYRVLCGKRFREQGVQTIHLEFFTELPSHIHINEKSKVFHTEGCKHVGTNSVQFRVCKICQNLH